MSKLTHSHPSWTLLNHALGHTLSQRTLVDIIVLEGTLAVANAEMVNFARMNEMWVFHLPHRVSPSVLCLHSFETTSFLAERKGDFIKKRIFT